jgi:hypothetical protein
MSGHAAFRRQPVPSEMAVNYQALTLPAPIRGIIEVENWAYVKPGCANIIDNWFPTQKGLRLRGGTERWAQLPDPVEIVRSGFDYVSGAVNRMFCATSTRIFDISFADTPVLQTGVGTLTNGYFSTAQFATAGGDWLIAVNDAGDHVRRFNGTTWAYLSTTAPAAWAISTAYAVGARALDTTDNTYWKCLVAHTSPGSGTFAAARTAAPSQWTQDTASDGVSWITGPPPAPSTVATGHGLTYVWKYRNRLFFVEGGTMNAYCLPINAVGGQLIYIPLSGAAKRGGSLLFGTSWSTGSSGDGIDNKCCFFTDQGEVLVFTGTDPTAAANWKQEGRYDISKPLGKNAHQQLGADVLVATVDGIVPLSAAIQKDVSALSLAAITYNIEPMWMRELKSKTEIPWSLVKWDEGDALFVNWPGGATYNKQTVGVSNLHTGAWSRYVGWDAMCFMRLRGNLFFGTQTGKIQQVESTGFDDATFDDVLHKTVGNTYGCRIVGGWEMFQSPPNQCTWFQARAAFFSAAGEPFEPQLTATTDYELRIPPFPNAGPDPGPLDVWDQGLWDQALWDQAGASITPVRNTMWVSIGETGFSHAPIVQVTIGQQFKPSVELISISATYIRMAANV